MMGDLIPFALKPNRKLLTTVLASTAMAMVSNIAVAEVETSFGLASTYLMRGYDKSNGRAQVFGDISYEHSTGLYTSLWGSSYGPQSSEYNVIAGWKKPFAKKAQLNIGLINYILPHDTAADDFGAESEAYIGINNGGFEAYVYKNVASQWQDNEGYLYLVTAYSGEKNSVTLGYAFNDDIQLGSALPEDTGKYQYIHFDYTYAVTEHVSFTFSKQLWRDVKLGGRDLSEDDFSSLAQNNKHFASVADDDLLFIVHYNAPLVLSSFTSK